MALNDYVIGTVKVLISNSKKDLLGDDSMQALSLLFDGTLHIYTVRTGLQDVLREGDVVLVEVGLIKVPDTNQAGQKNEIIKIIRGDTRERIENLYKAMTLKPKDERPGAV